MRYRALPVLCIILLSLSGISPLRSQTVTTAVSNVTRYGLGSETTLNGTGKKEYIENLSDVRIGIDKVTVGFRLEVNDPPEFGERFTGLKHRFVEYDDGSVSLRAGDLYTLFQRGTSLNLFENKTLAYDTGLDGFLLQYTSPLVSASAVSGVMDFFDPAAYALNTPRHDRYSIRGARLELALPLGFSVGAGMLSTDAGITDIFTAVQKPVRADIPELFLAYRSEPLEFFSSYTEKRTLPQPGGPWQKGSAFYASLSHTGDGYGLSAEWKDYRFDIVDPSGADPFRVTRSMPFQNPPTVKREHSFTSLSRNPHIVDFNDEVGVLAEFFLSPSEGTTVTLSGSLSSRHYVYVLDRTTFISRRTEKGSPLLPSLERGRSPFWEVMLEAEHYLSDGTSYVKGAFDRRYDFTFFEFGSTYIMATGIPLQALVMLDDSWSIKATIENLWTYHSAYMTDKESYGLIMTVQAAVAPDWSVGFRRETTTDPFDPSRRSVWIAADGSYRLGRSHLLSVMVGDERGGQVCANGICRQVNPFSGFRFTMISQL